MILERHTCGKFTGHQGCANCCARRIASTYPRRDLAEGMYATFSRFDGFPGKAAVNARVREMLSARQA